MTAATREVESAHVPVPGAHLPDAHLPGLDGLRALAVLAVLGYHLWPDLVPAGFLGVTVFFVLSGFLITRLLLAEHAATTTISLRGFWGRRARRLLPASLATLVVVSVIWMLEGWLTRAFAADILWSLVDLANWHTLASGATYGAAGVDSPVLHFWSLAIEEQCYLVLPLVAWAVLRWRGWSVRTLGRVVTMLLAASLAYTALHHGNADLIYLSTFSRVAELLVGVLLAVLATRWGGLPSDRAWPVIGAFAVVGLLVVMVTTTLDAPIYARGGLFIAALLAVIALVGAAVPGPLATVLGLAPLRWVGRVSYAVYLFHWPILMAFREAGIDAWYVAPATLAATFGLAAVSMRALEGPIRDGGRVVRTQGRLALAVATSIVVICTLGVAPPSADLDFATAQSQFDGLGDLAGDPLSGQLDGSVDGAVDGSVGDLHAPPTTDLPDRTGPPSTLPKPTVMVFGDSTGLMLGLSLLHTDVAEEVPGFANVGCPLSRGGSYRLSVGDDTSGKVFPATRTCDWTKKLPDLAGRSHPQLLLVSGGVIDTVPRKLSLLGPGWHTLDEQSFQDYLRSELDAAVDSVVTASPGTRVVLLTLSPDWKRGSAAHAARVDIVNRVIREVAVDRPDATEVVDLASWIDATGDRQRLCPDGLHLVPTTTGPEVFERFLGPRLQQIAARPAAAPSLTAH